MSGAGDDMPAPPPANLPEPRKLFGVSSPHDFREDGVAFTAGRRGVFAFGGLCTRDFDGCWLQHYDAEERAWVQLPSREGLEEFSCIRDALLLLDDARDAVYVFGGTTGPYDDPRDSPAELCLRFDMRTQIWEVPSVRGDVPKRRTASEPWRVAVVDDTAVILWSRLEGSRNGVHVHVFNFETRTFTHQATSGSLLLPGFVSETYTVRSVAADPRRQKMYALLGQKKKNYLWALSTATWTWALQTSFPVEDLCTREDVDKTLIHTTVLPDGRVLMVDELCAEGYTWDPRCEQLSGAVTPIFGSSKLRFLFIVAHGWRLLLSHGVCTVSHCFSVPLMEFRLWPEQEDVRDAASAQQQQQQQLCADLGALLASGGDDSTSDVAFTVEGQVVKAHRRVHFAFGVECIVCMWRTHASAWMPHALTPSAHAALSLVRPRVRRRAILVARSAYFRAMLTPDAFREASGAAIALPAVSHAVFALVLQFLYTGARVAELARGAECGHHFHHDTAPAMRMRVHWHMRPLTAHNPSARSPGSAAVPDALAQATLEAARFFQLPELAEQVVDIIVPRLSLVRTRTHA
jgi:hypothetical protein